MPTPIFSPTAQIEALCLIVDSSIESYLKVISNVSLGTYEHETTAYINILHSIRLLESIVELARKDLVYVESALVLARSAFEGLIRTTWILLPNDKFINETRYVAYLETECEYLEKLSKGFGNKSKTEYEFLNSKVKVNEFKNQLGKLLVDKGYVIPKFPNLRDMLKELNEERKYLFYVMLSQYSHFSHHSSKIYQQHLGTEKILTETENLDLWKLSFATTLPAFKLTTEFFLASLGNTQEIYSDRERDEFEELINSK